MPKAGPAIQLAAGAGAGLLQVQAAQDFRTVSMQESHCVKWSGVRRNTCFETAKGTSRGPTLLLPHEGYARGYAPAVILPLFAELRSQGNFFTAGSYRQQH